MTNKDFYDSLIEELKNSYEAGITMQEAERLAGKFLHAQIKLSEELKNADLDNRMKKSGLKAIRAAIYMEAATKDPKKPSDTLLEHLVNMNEIVINSQQEFDKSEVERDALQNYFNIMKEAHIHFRSIAKGKFE